MSTVREPLWYCHQCHAEMRPLMVPDPVCASCHGDFVEKMENPTDDPREFWQDDDHDEREHGGTQDMDTFMLALQALMGGGPPGMSRPSTRPSISLQFGGPSGVRTIHVARPGADLDARAHPTGLGAVPNMTTFLGPRRPADRRPGDIQGALLAHYLMALMNHHNPSGDMFGVPEGGRMGDYVFNQEALDQIITQLMENNNSHRPVPASEDVVTKLPREVLVEGSTLLEKDCAVCKEQFSLTAEDPDEHVVITLPCKHPFHEPCIVPWLKSSGTCPVCRFALVPQPEQHPPPGQPPNRDNPGGSPRSGPSSRNDPTSNGGRSGGLFHHLFGGLTGNHGRDNNNNNSNNRSNANDAAYTTPRSPGRRDTSNSSYGEYAGSGLGTHAHDHVHDHYTYYHDPHTPYHINLNLRNGGTGSPPPSSSMNTSSSRNQRYRSSSDPTAPPRSPGQRSGSGSGYGYGNGGTGGHVPGSWAEDLE